MAKPPRILILGLLWLVVFCLPKATNACECAGERPPCEELRDAKAVFIGRVIDSALQEVEVSQDGSRTVFDVGSIRFAIQEAFLGIKSAEVTITSGTSGSDCGYWFIRGETYLVYAFGEDGDLSTSTCTRTRLISKASEDLAFLRSLPARGTGGTLFGSINHYAGDVEHGPSYLVGPMAGIKVVVQGDKNRFELVTDSKGEYRMTGIASGKYDVNFNLPANLGAIFEHDTVDNSGSYSGHGKIEISDRACTRNNVTVWSDGRIAGRVTDPRGKPVKEMQIDLVSARSPENEWSAYSDADGHYEFRLVQPGQYFLGISLEFVPNSGNPYPRMYFPGAADQSRAKVINVADGEKLKGYDFVIPPRLTERAIEGDIVWPDGRPAAGASVEFEVADYAGMSMPTNVKADGTGHFSIRLFDGLSYLILADIEEPPRHWQHSELLELTPREGTEKVRLVLAKPGFGLKVILHAKRNRTK